ncbi:hypothetical protein QVM32_11490 [Pseudomonas asiatica]|uniref:hypothetical protein n=1 Tax=Pseudomonas asiatica TaxID=2219225 RepID=UPI0035250257
MAKTVGRAKKTETFTTRLEPKERYVLELLARVSGRSIAKTLEEGIRLQAAQTKIHIAGRPEVSVSVDGLTGILWSPQEWKRLVSLAAIAPDLLTHLEECKLALLFQAKFICQEPERSKTGAIKYVTLSPRFVELAWPIIDERAELMAEGKPAPPPSLMEILKYHNGTQELDDSSTETIMLDFTTFNRD